MGLRKRPVTLLFATNYSVTVPPMQHIADYITHVPVAVEPSDDGIGVTLTAAGVAVQLSGGAQTGHLPDRVYCAIDTALNAKAVASGSNMPVALDPSVWLHRCRRCKAPFIALPRTRLCSDTCRALAKHDAVLRSKAKRAGRSVEERLSGSGWRRFVCAQCGKRSAVSPLDQAVLFDQAAASPRTEGAPAADPEPMTIEELDREIAAMRNGCWER